MRKTGRDNGVLGEREAGGSYRSCDPPLPRNQLVILPSAPPPLGRRLGGVLPPVMASPTRDCGMSSKSK